MVDLWVQATAAVQGRVCSLRISSIISCHFSRVLYWEMLLFSLTKRCRGHTGLQKQVCCGERRRWLWRRRPSLSSFRRSCIFYDSAHIDGALTSTSLFSFLFSFAILKRSYLLQAASVLINCILLSVPWWSSLMAWTMMEVSSLCNFLHLQFLLFLRFMITNWELCCFRSSK